MKWKLHIIKNEEWSCGDCKLQFDVAIKILLPQVRLSQIKISHIENYVMKKLFLSLKCRFYVIENRKKWIADNYGLLGISFLIFDNVCKQANWFLQIGILVCLKYFF